MGVAALDIQNSKQKNEEEQNRKTNKRTRLVLSMPQHPRRPGGSKAGVENRVRAGPSIEKSEDRVDANLGSVAARNRSSVAMKNGGAWIERDTLKGKKAQ